MDDLLKEFEDLYGQLWGESYVFNEEEESAKEMPSSFSIDSNSQNIISSLDESMKPYARAFLEAAGAAGLKLTLTQGYRSKEYQERLYEQGRTTPGAVVTNAKPGLSKHNFGVAIDVAPLNEHGKAYWPNDEKLWEQIGQIGESVGLKWGGRWSKFKDRPHFEHPDYSMKDLLSGAIKTKAGRSIASYYLNKIADKKEKERNIRLLKLKLLTDIS